MTLWTFAVEGIIHNMDPWDEQDVKGEILDLYDQETLDDLSYLNDSPGHRATSAPVFCYTIGVGDGPSDPPFDLLSARFGRTFFVLNLNKCQMFKCHTDTCIDSRIQYIDYVNRRTTDHDSIHSGETQQDPRPDCQVAGKSGWHEQRGRAESICCQSASDDGRAWYFIH